MTQTSVAGESRRFRPVLYAALAAATLLVQGYHPFAEDGGLYAAGVEYRLHPSLFPHYTAFVTEHLRFSVFAPVLAALLQLTHLPLQAGLLTAYLLCTALLFGAADRVLQWTGAPRSRLGGLLLLAAWWTLPVAGTSLFLQDPYLTARSASTPLSLLAITFALEASRTRAQTAGFAIPLRQGMACLGCLLLAAAFHPLMCGYAVGLLLCMLAARSQHTVRWSLLFAVGVFLVAVLLQGYAAPETPAAIAADITRYYWFLSSWRWFELLGLAGPMLVLWGLQRWCGRHLTPAGKSLCRACILFGAVAVIIALLFAHPGYKVHAVARLQPLRSFVMIYTVMVLLLGAVGASAWKHYGETAGLPKLQRHGFAFVTPALLALGMFWVQRVNFARSDHLEVPSRFERSPNPWVQAFVWVRLNVPHDALFALDAHYITQSGEDAQAFRAIAERSVLPDFSKDGGEAAITPPLAPLWQTAMQAQISMDSLSDEQRDARVRPLGADWIVLATSTPTRHPCPYQNGVVKVCRIVEEREERRTPAN